ncbi:MAG: S8 family peptidase [Burkholderiales bacterium]|jgi:serine protease|nr:S8 family peptidase [Burkholderiales bacterium]
MKTNQNFFVAAVVSLMVSYAQAETSDRMIVRMKPSDSGRIQASEVLRDHAQRVVQSNASGASWLRSSDKHTHIFKFDPRASESDRTAHINRLRSDPNVEFAVSDRRVKTNAVSNDSLMSQQWYLNNNSVAGARFVQAWDQYRGSASTVVAVVDTGVLFNHPDLKDRLIAGYDFISSAAIANDGNGRDNNAADSGNWVSEQDRQTTEFSKCSKSDSSWHGTFVAAQIAGNTNDGQGIAGANWNTRLLPVRVLGKCGGYLSDVMDGARWAAGLPVEGIPLNPNPAKIINLSLGASGACGQFEQDAVNAIRAARAVVVAAAGNGGGAVDSPASCEFAIAVGAVDFDGQRASYSAIGSKVSIMAPGGDEVGLIGANNDGLTEAAAHSYGNKRGTSFAAPLVSAALALAHGLQGTMDYDQAATLLRNSARPFAAARSSESQCVAGSGPVKCVCTTSVCGSGMLDANNLVSLARAGKSLANPTIGNTTDSNSGWTLDSRNSVAATGRLIVSHKWIQKTGPVTLTLTNSNTPGLVRTSAPTQAGEYIFEVTVEDSNGASHTSRVARIVGVQQLADGTTNNGGSGAGTGNNGNTQSGTDSTTQTPVTTTGGSGGGGGGALPIHLLAIMALGILLLRSAEKVTRQKIA